MPGKIKSMERITQKKTISLSCYLILLSGVFVGLFTSVYLSISHYRHYMDIGYQSFCAISHSLNCDTAAQSTYAIFLDVPIGVWGIIGYLVFLLFVLLLFLGKNSESAQVWAGCLFITACIFTFFSVYLAGIATFKIHSYCLMCSVLYGVSFILLCTSWLIWKRAGEGTVTDRLKRGLFFLREKRRWILFAGAGFLVVSGALVLFYPKYWQSPELFVSGVAVNSGITEGGHPWMGSEKPVLTIEEYTDYMCFQCGKMHHHLRNLVSQYPDQIRLVHRHFPLDNTINPAVKKPIHPNSGLISLFAIISQDHNLFWIVNDLLFRDAREKGVIHFGDIGRQAHLDMGEIGRKMNDQIYMDKLKKDIQEGLQWGITATPSYVIDGKVYVGKIPDTVLRSVIQ